MKKYMKPMMESECFVSNEYISTCYTMTCTECNGYYEGKTEWTGEKDPTEAIKTTTNGLYTINTYSGDLGGKPSCQTYTENKKPGWVDKWWEEILYYLFEPWLKEQTTTSYHVVEVDQTNGWTHTNHPNASV